MQMSQVVARPRLTKFGDPHTTSRTSPVESKTRTAERQSSFAEFSLHQLAVQNIALKYTESKLYTLSDRLRILEY